MWILMQTDQLWKDISEKIGEIWIWPDIREYQGIIVNFVKCDMALCLWKKKFTYFRDALSLNFVSNYFISTHTRRKDEASLTKFW